MEQQTTDFKKVLQDLDCGFTRTNCAIEALGGLLMGIDANEPPPFSGGQGLDLRFGLKEICDLIAAEQARIIQAAFDKTKELRGVKEDEQSNP